MVGKYTNVELGSEGEGVEASAGNIVVRLMRTDEGVVCDMYDSTILEFADDDAAHMAACYTFFHETVRLVQEEER